MDLTRSGCCPTQRVEIALSDLRRRHGRRLQPAARERVRSRCSSPQSPHVWFESRELAGATSRSITHVLRRTWRPPGRMRRTIRLSWNLEPKGVDVAPEPVFLRLV